MTSPQPLRDDLAALVAEPPDNPDRLVAVRRRARRMRRNRAAGAGLAVIAIVVAVVAATGVGPMHRGEPVAPAPAPAPGQPDPAALPTGILLEDAHGNVVRLADLRATTLTNVRGLKLFAHGEVRALLGTTAVSFDSRLDVVAVDARDPVASRVILPNLTRDRRHPVSEITGLGRREIRKAIVGRGGGSLWLWVVGPHVSMDILPTGGQLVRIDLAGHLTAGPFTLPGGSVPVDIASTGIYVVTDEPGEAAPRVDRVGFDGSVSLVGHASIDVLASPTYGMLAWETPNCSSGSPSSGAVNTCFVNVLDTETGHAARYTVRMPVGELMPEFGVISPDGRYFASLVSGLPIADGHVSTALGVLDMHTGKATIVPSSTLADWTSIEQDQFRWSGDRLLWALTHESVSGARTTIGAYLPATGKSVTTTVAASGLTVLAAD